MNRTALTCASVAAAAMGAGAVLTGNAQAARTLHTLHFKTHQLHVANTSTTTFAETDAVSKSGKTVGYETLSCNDGGTKVKCSWSLSLPNGMLLGYLTTPITTSDKTTLAGKVTGGLGKYSGVKGMIKAAVNGKNASYSISYHS